MSAKDESRSAQRDGTSAGRRSRWRLPVGHPLHLGLGLSVWGVWFAVAYGGLSLACVAAPPVLEAGSLNWINGVIGVLTLLTTGGLAWAAWITHQARQRSGAGDKPADDYIAMLSVALYAVAAVSTLFTGLPLVVVPPCL